MESNTDDIKQLKESLDKYTPIIPEQVIDYFLEKSGVSYTDKNVKKFISLIVQKFATDIAVSAYQYHKIIQKGQQKDKRFAKEKKITFTVHDLEKALEEMGIDISRPHYYM